MLAFVTSLAHPDNVADLARSDALLERTLRSLAQQSDQNCVVIVVGERAPGFELPPRTEFIQVDFPPRVDPPGPRDRDVFRRNKGSKVAIGLIRARELAAEYVMIFDYDDFVHRDVARFVNANPGTAGWYVSTGWLHSQRRNVIQPVINLDKRCGTSHILPLSVYEVPADMTVTATQPEVLEAFGPRITSIIGRHRGVRELLAERGIMLQRFPFPSVFYNVETSVNMSGARITGFVHPLTSRRAEAFGIRPSTSLLHTLRFVLAPSALLQGSRLWYRRLKGRLRR